MFSALISRSSSSEAYLLLAFKSSIAFSIIRCCLSNPSCSFLSLISLSLYLSKSCWATLAFSASDLLILARCSSEISAFYFRFCSYWSWVCVIWVSTKFLLLLLRCSSSFCNLLLYKSWRCCSRLSSDPSLLLASRPLIIEEYWLIFNKITINVRLIYILDGSVSVR